MEKLIIEGGIPLHGKIKVSGSKNAALPILFAAILCDGESKLENVPALRDIATTQSLLETLGCEARREGDSIFIKPQKINSEASYDLVRTMRASVLCLGPLLARTGHARVAMPGGCAIGARPVDQHLKGFEKLGAEFTLEEGYIIGRCKKLRGDRIVFDMPTVGGTENVLMAAAVAEGETVLENAAREPEIVDLANFLIACGAKIEGHGHSVVHIQGNPNLRAASYSVMPDRIEAGTFLVAAGITGGQLEVQNFPGATMENIIEKLRSMGMKIEKTTDGNALASTPDGLECVDVKTLPYPGFPTDMQAQIMALMCMAKGSGLIEESIFENRFMHVPELNRMGAQIQVRGRTALVRGMKKLSGAPVMASDLRASASLVLAGLAAEGTTEVDRIYHLDRGYEHIEDKLNAVGAKIRRVKDFRPE